MRSARPTPLSTARALTRVVLALPFVGGGLEYFKDRKTRVGLVQKLGYPVPEVAAFVDASAKVGCGLALAFGVAPELSALGLIANLGPTTVSMHPFWKETDPRSQAMQRNAFIINISVAGGLLGVITARRRG